MSKNLVDLACSKCDENIEIPILQAERMCEDIKRGYICRDVVRPGVACDVSVISRTRFGVR